MAELMCIASVVHQIYRKISNNYKYTTKLLCWQYPQKNVQGVHSHLNIIFI